MAKTRKARVPKLSKWELTLAEYPPNEGTWQCQNEYEVIKVVKGVDEVGKMMCGMPNVKQDNKCTFCRTARPRKPKQLHPIYVKVMRKLGLPIGTKFMVSYNNGTKNGTWKYKRGNQWVEWTTEILEQPWEEIEVESPTPRKKVKRK